MKFEIIYHNVKTNNESVEYIYADSLHDAMQLAAMNRKSDEYAYVSSDETELSGYVAVSGDAEII